MVRHLKLRQIEAFQAVIENGTISRAAQILNISQPAMSKLIAHLEFDTGLRLFDRVKGRIAPTEHAMRLHDEVGRIFAGVRQVENAVEAIRREEQERLSIGVMVALAGSFIQRATVGFLEKQPDVFCTVQSRSSQIIVDWLISRKLDVGLVGVGFDNPYVTHQPLIEHPLVCVLPLNHALARKKEIDPQDLHEIDFVSFDPSTYLGYSVEGMFDNFGVRPKIKVTANMGLTVCEFVAAGLGVSLVHPLMASGLEQRLIVRRFGPKIPYSFQLCRIANSRNAQLVEYFAQELEVTATQISSSLLGNS